MSEKSSEQLNFDQKLQNNQENHYTSEILNNTKEVEDGEVEQIYSYLHKQPSRRSVLIQKLQKIAVTLAVHIYFLIWQIIYIIQNDSYLFPRLAITAYLILRMATLSRLPPILNSYLTSAEILINFAYAGYSIKNQLYSVSSLNMFLQGQIMGVILFFNDTSKLLLDILVVVCGQSSLFLVTQNYQLDDIFKSVFCIIQILYLKYVYYSTQRQTFLNFLLEKTQHELMDRIIPIQLIVVAYNEVTQRIELVESNLRAKVQSKITNDEGLEEFLSLSQLKFFSEIKSSHNHMKIQSLKDLLIEIYQKSKQADKFNLEMTINAVQEKGDLFAFHRLTKRKYKVKILQRVQTSSDIIVALEDLCQIEELRVIKQKAKKADKYLSSFLEYLSSQIQSLYSALDLSKSQLVIDPVQQFQYVKKQIEKLFNIVQNLEEIRNLYKNTEDKKDSGQVQGISTTRAIDFSQLVQFNFANLMDDIKRMFQNIQFINQHSFMSSNSLNKDVSADECIVNDYQKIRSIFLTILFNLEESLPLQYLKLVQCSYSMKSDSHFESIQVRIKIPSLLYTSTQQNDSQEAVSLLKSILDSFATSFSCESSSQEIRNFEFSQLRNFIQKLGPYDLKIEEEQRRVENNKGMINEIQEQNDEQILQSTDNNNQEDCEPSEHEETEETQRKAFLLNQKFTPSNFKNEDNFFKKRLKQDDNSFLYQKQVMKKESMNSFISTNQKEITITDLEQDSYQQIDPLKNIDSQYSSFMPISSTFRVLDEASKLRQTSIQESISFRREQKKKQATVIKRDSYQKQNTMKQSKSSLIKGDFYKYEDSKNILAQLQQMEFDQLNENPEVHLRSPTHSIKIDQQELQKQDNIDMKINSTQSIHQKRVSSRSFILVFSLFKDLRIVAQDKQTPKLQQSFNPSSMIDCQKIPLAYSNSTASHPLGGPSFGSFQATPYIIQKSSKKIALHDMTKSKPSQSIFTTAVNNQKSTPTQRARNTVPIFESQILSFFKKNNPQNNQKSVQSFQ